MLWTMLHSALHSQGLGEWKYVQRLTQPDGITENGMFSGPSLALEGSYALITDAFPEGKAYAAPRGAGFGTSTVLEGGRATVARQSLRRGHRRRGDARRPGRRWCLRVRTPRRSLAGGLQHPRPQAGNVFGGSLGGVSLTQTHILIGTFVNSKRFNSRPRPGGPRQRPRWPARPDYPRSRSSSMCRRKVEGGTEMTEPDRSREW